MFGRKKLDRWEETVKRMPGVTWFAYTGQPQTLGDWKVDRLLGYYLDLQSGRWGKVIDIWFDKPLASSDIPWEPCAITRGGFRFRLISEDFAAQPRRLKEESVHSTYEEALAAAKRLRPWGPHRQ